MTAGFYTIMVKLFKHIIECILKLMIYIYNLSIQNSIPPEKF